MAKKSIDIDYIVIWRNLNQVASKSEEEELQRWLSSDRKHQLLYEHLSVRVDKDILFTDEHIEKQWEQLQNRLIAKPRVLYTKWLQYAAAIILPLMIGLGVMYLSDKETGSVETAHQIQPGSSKAMLQLANGESIELDAASESLIKNKEGQVIGVDSMAILTYSAEAAEEQEFNTINIPRGGEYQLVLADGTTVWLNSESSLTYPVAFTGDTREVFLTGEAYFDVTSDKDVPFIVKTEISDVKVYGTQFNVMAYKDDKISETTLVEGSIAVLYNNEELMVKPGQQAQVSTAEEGVVIREVDTHLYTDWKSGIFRFEEMSLKEVAVKLSRWYDVDFFFANEEVKERTISGAMKRNTDFSLFMSLIEKSAEARISIEGNNVLVEGKY